MLLGRGQRIKIGFDWRNGEQKCELQTFISHLRSCAKLDCLHFWEQLFTSEHAIRPTYIFNNIAFFILLAINRPKMRQHPSPSRAARHVNWCKTRRAAGWDPCNRPITITWLYKFLGLKLTCPMNVLPDESSELESGNEWRWSIRSRIFGIQPNS